LKIALIGAGGMAMSHVQAYKMLGVKSICAVVDPVIENAMRAAEPFGAHVYDSVDKMLEFETPDVVDICAPSFLHSEYALLFIKRKIHVLCEKPMAHTVDDANRMIDAAKENGVCLMIGQILRFWPEYEYLKELIDSGTYGEVRHIELKRQYGMHPHGSWYMDPELCKMVCFEMHIHDADFVNYVFGFPDAVDSVGIEEPDIHMSYISTRYLYNDRPSTIIQAEGGWSDSSLPFAGGYRVTFNHAVLEYDKGILMLYESGREPKQINLTDGSIPHDLVALKKELNEFLNAVQGKGQIKTVTPESSRDTIRLVSAELVSSTQRKPFFFKA